MAYSEDYPSIIVECSGVGGTWSGITDYVYDFNINDAGIRKTSQVTINLHNQNGRFTNPLNASYLGLHRELRIRVDVGVWSGIVFYGNIYAFDPDDYRIKGTMRSQLTIVARGKYAQRCLRETITHPYYDNGWTASGAIMDFLEFPDSNVNTNIVLDLDTNSLMATSIFPTNPSQSNLLQCVQDACEEYGYDGYFGNEFALASGTHGYHHSGVWSSGTYGVLHLRSYRAPSITVSGANPPIHYILSSGLTECRPKIDIEDIKNYIFAHGGTDAGYPPTDYWTENPITILSGSWVAIGNCALSEDDVIYQGDINSLRVTTTAINTDPWCDIDVMNAGYIRPQIPACGTMDFTDDRFDELEVYFRLNYVGDDIAFRLIDANGDTVQNFHFEGIGAYVANTWYNYAASVRVADQGAPTWNLVAPSVAFDWSIVRHVQVIGSNAANIGEYMNVDLLHFIGVGWLVDPFIYVGYGSPQYDLASIRAYGRTVYHHRSDEIISFEQAYAEAMRILEENKDPFQRIEVSKGARVWAQPSETAQVTILPWNISGATYRILERTIRYNADTKLLRTTHDLISLDAEVSSQTIRAEKTWGSLQLEDSR